MESVNEVAANVIRGQRVRERSRDGYLSKLKQLVSYIENDEDFCEDREWVQTLDDNTKVLKVPFDMDIALKVFGRLSRDLNLRRQTQFNLNMKYIHASQICVISAFL
jgi:hypothetical protein